MRKRKYFWQQNVILWQYILAAGTGIIFGFKIVPSIGVASLYLLLCGALIYYAFTGNVRSFLTTFPFAIYTEIFVRAYAKWVPYLTLQYLLIFAFSLFLIKGLRNRKSHFTGYIFLALFMLLELLDNVSPDKPEVGRVILVNTLVLTLVVFWASVNVLSAVTINKILTNIKIAAIYLTGIVLVAHLQGKINYASVVSNSDASNGMAPVQLSGYLGTGCILFFLSIMNREEYKVRWTNIALLAFCATVMILTFSRGGLYFIGAVVALFLWYNRTQLGNYFKFIFLIPIALFIYSIVVNQTGGKILERYNQEGASNRDVLVGIGWELFLRHPITGVGTGNYNTRIVKEKLFFEESGAHNEFIRAAAEHGIFGIILYWGFFISLFFSIRRRGQPQQQFAMYFFALFSLITIHNGLKISLQPILILLAVAITSPSNFIYRKKIKNQLVVNKLPEPTLT